MAMLASTGLATEPTTGQVATAAQAALPDVPAAPYNAQLMPWGHLRAGLTSVNLAVLPRVQLSTSPLIDLLGIPHLGLQLQPLDLDAIDVTVTTDGAWLPMGDFQGGTWTVGLRLSAQLSRRVSLHVAPQARWMRGKGLPTAMPWLITAAAPSLPQLGRSLAPLVGSPLLSSDAIYGRATVRVQLNENFALLTQGFGVLSARHSASSDEAADGVIKLLEGLDVSSSGAGPDVMAASWSLVVAVEGQWGKASAKAGLGYSSVPGVWAAQAVDVAWQGRIFTPATPQQPAPAHLASQPVTAPAFPRCSWQAHSRPSSPSGAPAAAAASCSRVSSSWKSGAASVAPCSCGIPGPGPAPRPWPTWQAPSSSSSDSPGSG